MVGVQGCGKKVRLYTFERCMSSRSSRGGYGRYCKGLSRRIHHTVSKSDSLLDMKILRLMRYSQTERPTRAEMLCLCSRKRHAMHVIRSSLSTASSRHLLKDLVVPPYHTTGHQVQRLFDPVYIKGQILVLDCLQDVAGDSDRSEWRVPQESSDMTDAKTLLVP